MKADTPCPVLNEMQQPAGAQRLRWNLAHTEESVNQNRRASQASAYARKWRTMNSNRASFSRSPPGYGLSGWMGGWAWRQAGQTSSIGASPERAMPISQVGCEARGLVPDLRCANYYSGSNS